jgi:fatty-acyl-CoA synthase
LINLGVKRGDHVVMMPSPCPEFTALYFATLQIGAVINPLNLLWGVIEFTGIFQRNDPKVIVTVDKYGGRDYIKLIRESIPDLKVKGASVSSGKIPTLTHLISLSRQGEKYEGFVDFGDFMKSGAGYSEKEMAVMAKSGKCTDIQFICQTSGSTGLSKSALWDHRPPLSSAHFGIRFMNFTEEDTYINLAPYYHNSGIFALNVVIALSGALLFLNEVFDPKKAVELIDKYRITSSFGFDPHWQAMRKVLSTGNYKFTIRKACTAITPKTFDMVHDEMCKTRDATFVQLYAQTENGPAVTFVEPDCVLYDIRKYTNGRPLAGVEMVIKDTETGEKLPPNKQGEICYRSPYLFKGYYKQEEEMKKAFDEEGYFHSGDYGTFDNGYLTFLGRLGGIVKSGGENVSTTYVNSLLLDIFPDEFDDAHTLGVPDPYWGTKIVSWVRLKPGKELRPLKDIREMCKGKMAEYEIPKEILKWEGQWPMHSSGKIDAKVLMEKMKKALGI